MKRTSLRKTVFVSVLVVLLAVATALPSFAATPRDCENHWAKNQINSWINKGWAKGYSDGTFRPDGQVTRAEFMAFVNRAMGFDMLGYVSFNDVKATDWFYEDVRKAVYIGYITGYLDGSLKPNAKITRQEVAAVIGRLLELSETTDAVSYADYNSIDSWARGYVGAVLRMELMTGYGDRTFRPKNYITRAECITSIEKAIAELDKNTTQDVYVTSSSYGSGSTTTVNGNLYINYNGAVTLQNVAVKGNIIFQSRLGTQTVTMNSVTCTGSLEADYGNAVINDCNINVINATYSGMTLTAKGKTSVSTVNVYDTANLTHTSLNTSYTGFADVILKGKSYAVTTLAGNFDRVQITNNYQYLNLASGRIADLVVTGLYSKTVLGPDTNVTNATISGQGSVLGAGTIGRATINSSSVVLQRRPSSSVTGNYTPSYTGESTVTLTVRNSVDGTVVKGAVVKLSGLFDQQTSDANGRIVFYNVPMQSVDYTVTCTNYTERTGTFQPNTTTYSAYIDIVPTGKYTATITVKDSSGSAISGATVTMTTSPYTSVTTNTSGVATFTALNTGTFSYQASYTGYVTATDSVSITTSSASKTTTLTPTKLTVTAKTATIDSTSSTAINTFEVSLNNSTYQKATGSYSVSKLSYGSTYTVKVRATGYSDASTTVVITGSDTKLEVALNSSDECTFNVTVAGDSKTIENATVELENSGGKHTAKSDKNGIATLTKIPKGTYTMKVIASGFDTFIKENVTVSANGSDSATLTALRTVTVTVKSAGNPVSGAKVSLGTATNPDVYTANTASNGVATLLNIPDKANYVLTITHSSYNVDTEIISVSAAATSFERDISSRNYTLSLTIVNSADNSKLVGYTVDIVDSQDKVVKSGVTNSEGVVSLALTQGDYIVRVSKDGGSPLNVINSNIPKSLFANLDPIPITVLISLA